MSLFRWLLRLSTSSVFKEHVPIVRKSLRSCFKSSTNCRIRPNWGLVQKEARHSRWKRNPPRGWSQLEHAAAASKATSGSLWRLGQENRLVTGAFDFGMVVALEDSSSRQICHTMHLSHFQETLVFAITLRVVHGQIWLGFLRHCLDATDIVQQYKVAHPSSRTKTVTKNWK